MYTIIISVLIFTSYIYCNDVIDLTDLGPKIYGVPLNSTGDLLDKWTPEMEMNPEEQGEYFQGDILFPNTLARNGLKTQTARWPRGVIPYELKGYFNSQQKNMIAAAMDDYHTYTCIKFIPRGTRDTDYLTITSANTGCWSSVGRIGGRQELNLQAPGCVTKKGTPIHELMHAVGFLHEQNRSERDGYVNIVWSNIQKGRENNFEKARAQDVTAFDVGYDLNSVMHYSETAFSVNGQKTIVPKKNSNMRLGQRDGFSKQDIMKINRMYNCKNKM